MCVCVCVSCLDQDEVIISQWETLSTIFSVSLFMGVGSGRVDYCDWLANTHLGFSGVMLRSASLQWTVKLCGLFSLIYQLNHYGTYNGPIQTKLSPPPLTHPSPNSHSTETVQKPSGKSYFNLILFNLVSNQFQLNDLNLDSTVPLRRHLLCLKSNALRLSACAGCSRLM